MANDPTTGPFVPPPAEYKLKGYKVDSLTTKNQNFHQRQIKNAAPATDLDDYVTLRQLKQATGQAVTSTPVTPPTSGGGSGGGAITALGGDLSGSPTSQTVVGIQTIPVASTTPVNGQVLTYVTTDGKWEPKTPSSGGGTTSNLVVEIPAGLLNGSNKIFTISTSPSVIILFLNGVEQKHMADYVLSSNTITYNVPPLATDWHECYYGNVSGGGGGGGGAVASVFGRTGMVVANVGDYTAAQVTNAVDQTGSYVNPAWIASLPYSKITGAPSGGTPPAGSNSQVQFNSSGSFGASSVFTWDNTNHRLGVNQSTPGYTIDATGDINATGNFRTNGVILAQTPWQGNIDAQFNNLNNIGTINSGNNVLGFAVNGIGRFVIDLNGKFDFYPTSGVTQLNLNGTTANIFLNYTTATHEMDLTSDGTLRLTGTVVAFGSLANVAWAEASKQFVVNGYMRTTGTTTSYPNSGSGVEIYWDTYQGVIQSMQRAVAGNTYEPLWIDASPILLNRWSGASVGIGIASPAYKLDVGGDINTSGVFRVNGVPISTGGGGTVPTIYKETPVGAMNGSNRIFTVSYVPIANSLLLFLNGIEQTGFYTIAGVTITFSTPPISTDVIIAQYSN